MAMRRELPDFRFVQIDDGYQAYMGDWLTVRPAFGDLDGLLRTIREQGGEAAIWVAPFIAEASSALLREHPEFFVHDEEGRPGADDRAGRNGFGAGLLGRRGTSAYLVADGPPGASRRGAVPPDARGQGRGGPVTEKIGCQRTLRKMRR